MYRLRPKLELSRSFEIIEGYKKIIEKILNSIRMNNSKKIVFETFPGADTGDWITYFKDNMDDVLVVDTSSLFVSSEEITADIQEDLTSDEVFGRFSNKSFKKYLDPIKVKELYENINQFNRVLIYGVGASEVIEADFTVYADIARWEIQLKHRAGMKNWKNINDDPISAKLKRSYYFEWPAGEQIKDKLLPICDFYVDMNDDNNPKMITGQDMQDMLKEFTEQPFRLKPYFDSGVWGGHWMQKNFNIEKDKINLAWSFDGVPEENSVLMSSGDQEIEMPAYNIITLYPVDLLGEKVYGRFGRDYPIRFNVLDTMGGQNLSLQVHPTLDYAYYNFGAKYTQDESYYVLEAENHAVVYLGVKNGVSRKELIEAFEESQITGEFEEEKYVNKIPMKKHDHYLIPAGTIHSSGKDSVVLEISSTPNRFTFKLWDWGRVDLDGKPRPISLHHGRHVINTEYDTNFVNNELYNNFKELEENNDYKEEHTGLHVREAIETRRLTVRTEVEQTTEGSTNMLKLVEGEHVQIVSMNNEFTPYDVYFGETFIIPEKIKEYKIVTIDSEAIVIKAYIR